MRKLCQKKLPGLGTQNKERGWREGTVGGLQAGVMSGMAMGGWMGQGTGDRGQGTGDRGQGTGDKVDFTLG